MARIALFGGSFDPPHVAHQLACLYVLETSGCDEVWMVPAARHPFAKSLAPFEDRFEMCKRAAARLEGVVVSRVEEELGGESRTLHTVQHLRRTRPGDTFLLVLGADLLAERRAWLGWDELERLVEIVVIGREGHGGPEPCLPAVSSSEIRRRLQRGEDVSRLVSGDVLAYIQERSLYRA
jgi:nicotinate-nucleotide adenylyltransferase